MYQKDMQKSTMCGAEEFATAVEWLMTEARARGVSNETLLIEIEDMASLLREAIDQ